MGRARLAAGLAALTLAPAASPAEDFYAYWGDGQAEVSSYRVVQPRYGEPREGYGVLVFVTEDLNRHTLIKVESPTPVEDRVYALKLNQVLKFTTGIYDYSVMTSVFSAVEPRAEEGPFELQKITLTSQEWCGHVFEEVEVRDGQVRGDLNSYFEREGKQAWHFDKPPTFASEDHLLIEVRELKGEFLAPGERRGLTLLPSLWQLRARHRQRELVQASLHKGLPETVNAGGAQHTAVPWTWAYGETERTVWVDTVYPHRILQWQGSDGERGELLVSLRLPYWSLHDGDDLHYRDELRIPR